jgi:ABC-2 type transport system permease protein
MRIFVHELRGEMQLYSRSRELAFFTFMLPLIFYVLLGSVYGSGDTINGYPGADYLLTGMIGYGLIATGFAGLAIVLVIRRENGVLKRLRATPLPAWMYIAAVLLTDILAFALMSACLIALAIILFGASFPKAPASLVVTIVLGGACFAALGVAITGFIRRAEGASAVINAIYLPVAFISGAFFSQQHFPEVLQRVANVLPLTYFIDLVGDVMLKGTPIWDEPKDVAVIAAWGIAGALISLRYFRWVPREG